MRILHLLNHTRRLNGHVHAAVDLACAQRSLGHDVAIASEGGDFDALLKANHVETMVVDHERRPAKLLKGLSALRRLMKNWRPDVIHAHMMTSAVLAWPICKLAGIPLVTTVHNEFEKSAILMGLGTRVIAVSTAVGEAMHKRGIPKSQIDVVLNGTIGSARFDGRDRTPHRFGAPTIIFVGGLHPRKGLPDLFTAFDELYQTHPQTRLVIVGGGPHLEEYEQLARRLGSADAITFKGPHDEPFPFLLGADIFVLPSHADPAPLVVSEAREAHCAIIATNVDGIPQLLEFGKAGVLIPPRDPARLADAMRMLLSDPARLKLWRENSQINIQHMRIDRVARETLSVYAAALAQGGRREVQPQAHARG